MEEYKEILIKETKEKVLKLTVKYYVDLPYTTATGDGAMRIRDSFALYLSDATRLVFNVDSDNIGDITNKIPLGIATKKEIKNKYGWDVDSTEYKGNSSFKSAWDIEKTYDVQIWSEFSREPHWGYTCSLADTEWICVH